MTLYAQDLSGSYVEASDDFIVQAALSIADGRIRHGPALNRRNLKEYLLLLFSKLEHEVFAIIYLDGRNRVIDCEALFRGTIDSAKIYSREVMKAVLGHNAAAVIFVHNHPSGIPEPSTADQLMTQRLKEALALIDVRVLDHMIVGMDTVESFDERELL